jgi:tetratricopeptide (TPR) repeat protein
MASSRQLGFAGRAPAGRSLIPHLAILLLLACTSATCSSQALPDPADPATSVRQLFAEERWQEIVDLLKAIALPSAELNYYYGIALAQLGRWDESRGALLAGRHQQPYDKRFPIELAGVAFKRKRYPEATAWLRRTLRLDPSDAYANDFLATTYFLQGNLEAALKYWNRVGKPQIEEVRVEPQLRVSPALLDHAFAFSPASMLNSQDLLTSQTRVAGLQIFPSYTFDLAAREDGKFDVVFRATERNGWGNNKWEGLLSMFRGVFVQTIYPEFFNWRGSAINLVSLVRWDAEKRRVMASVSSPVSLDAKRRYYFGLDLRNENWDIRNSFKGPAPLLAALNLRKESLTGGLRSFTNSRWNWSLGVELSHRDFRSVLPGPNLTPALLSEGYQLKQMGGLSHELWRLPERRLVTSTSVNYELGRIWSQPEHFFAKLQASLTGHWLPQAHGNDYETTERVRAGATFGQIPFDELWMLGLERDNDLWLRAHPGTRNGRKGSAPLGRTYLLSNWELDKNVFTKGFVGLKLGPFLDTGAVTDSTSGLGADKWLWDTGTQAKLRLLGPELTFVYGKDLRSGNNAFYVTVGPQWRTAPR